MFQGSIVALVTPMHDDGTVDESALADLVEFHIAEGTDGIVAVGTTGESATLSVPEHAAVIQRVVRVAAGRVPVIAGTGANATAEAIELTRHAKAVGADAALLVTPYYNKPTQAGLLAHYRAVAVAVDIPQILYNVPNRTALDMAPETTAELSRVDNIVGIKEAFGEPARIARLVEICKSDFVVLTGDDGSARESLYAGAKGDISVTANVVPKAMHELCAAAVSGDRETADQIDARIGDLHSALFLESNPITVKWALKEMGRIGPGIRLPLTELDANHHDAVRRALRKAGALSE